MKGKNGKRRIEGSGIVDWSPRVFEFAPSWSRSPRESLNLPQVGVGVRGVFKFAPSWSRSLLSL